jgi:hypothetical protein
VWVAVVLALVLGVASASARLAFDALVQRGNAERGQAKAFARFEAGFQLVWVVGALAPVLVRLPFAAGGFSGAGLAGGAALAYGAALASLRVLQGAAGTPAPGTAVEVAT